MHEAKENEVKGSVTELPFLRAASSSVILNAKRLISKLERSFRAVGRIRSRLERSFRVNWRLRSRLERLFRALGHILKLVERYVGGLDLPKPEVMEIVPEFDSAGNYGSLPVEASFPLCA